MNITTTSLKQELKLRKIHNSARRSEATISLKLRLLLRRSLTRWVVILAVRLQRLPSLELKLLSR